MNKTLKISDNITLTHIDDDKFKAGYVSVYFVTPRTKSDVSRSNLLARVLRTSCEKYKSAQELDKKLESLYDSSLSIIAEPMGQYHLTGFRVKMVTEDFLPEKITDEIFELIGNIIFHPNLNDEAFDEKYFDIEKSRLIQLIDSEVNDKSIYATIRANELMFYGSPQGIRSSGYKDEIEKITPKILYEHYKNTIANSPVNITLAGKFDIEKAKEKLGKIFTQKPTFTEVEDIKVVKDSEFVDYVEKMDVTQAKLVMYYEFGVSQYDDDFYDFIVMNSVFGSGTSSKLFMNVREKHSICYSISSGVQKYTGTVMVYAAVDPKDIEKAVTLIDEQMNSMKKGDITDEEMNYAKKSYITALNSLEDRLSDLSDFYYRQSFSKKPKTIEEIKSVVENVTRQDVIAVAQKAKLCCKYVLDKN